MAQTCRALILDTLTVSNLFCRSNAACPDIDQDSDDSQESATGPRGIRDDALAKYGLFGCLLRYLSIHARLRIVYCGCHFLEVTQPARAAMMAIEAHARVVFQSFPCSGPSHGEPHAALSDMFWAFVNGIV
jgi:hypothetical protein